MGAAAAGTVLATGERVDRPDRDLREGVVLRAFELADGQRVRVEVPAPAGGEPAVFDVVRAGDRVRATATGARGWSLAVGTGPAARADGDGLVVDLTSTG